MFVSEVFLACFTYCVLLLCAFREVEGDLLVFIPVLRSFYYIDSVYSLEVTATLFLFIANWRYFAYLSRTS